MIRPSRFDARVWARVYFAVQASAGLLWWVGVFLSDTVRSATLGDLGPKVIVGPDLILFVAMAATAAATGSRWPALLTAGWSVAVTIGLFVFSLVTRSAGWGVLAMIAAGIGGTVAAATIWIGHLPMEWFFIGPFAFREADTADPRKHLRRSLVQLVVFWTAFFVLVPIVVTFVEARLMLHLAWLDQPAATVVGAVAFTVGCALGLWSCVTMALQGLGTPLPAATATELVIVGPYRFVRNPMALAGGIQTAALGLWLGSWILIVLAFAGGAAWHVCIRPSEEADLANRFGTPYDKYRSQTRLWIPRVTKTKNVRADSDSAWSTTS